MHAMLKLKKAFFNARLEINLCCQIFLETLIVHRKRMKGEGDGR